MKKLTFIFMLLASQSCFAAYTGNHSSEILWVKIYNNDTIYFLLKTMPADHQCATNYFVLKNSLTEKQRDRYYTMLMTAKASGTAVTVGYDKNNADCLNNVPVVYSLLY